MSLRTVAGLTPRLCRSARALEPTGSVVETKSSTIARRTSSLRSSSTRVTSCWHSPDRSAKCTAVAPAGARPAVRRPQRRLRSYSAANSSTLHAPSVSRSRSTSSSADRPEAQAALPEVEPAAGRRPAAPELRVPARLRVGVQPHQVQAAVPLLRRHPCVHERLAVVGLRQPRERDAPRRHAVGDRLLEPGLHRAAHQLHDGRQHRPPLGLELGEVLLDGGHGASVAVSGVSRATAAASASAPDRPTERPTDRTARMGLPLPTRGSPLRATLMYGAGDVRVEDVPDPGLRAAHRRPGARPARLHLRQRPAPVPLDAGRRRGPADGARVPRRRRGRRRRGLGPGPRRRRDRAVRLLRRHLRLLPGGPAHLLPRRRLLGRRAASAPARPRRCACRTPTGPWCRCPSGEDDPLLPSLLTLSDVFPTGYHCAVTAGVGPGLDGDRHRRRRGRPVRGPVGQAARRRADRPHGPPPGPHRPRPGLRRHRRRRRARAGRASSGSAS